jgi:hypothetical protein
LTTECRESGCCTTSAVDLFNASVFRDADFITLRMLDDSPELKVFFGMLDDKQKFLLQRL